MTTSKEQTHFTRLSRLLINIGTQVLKDQFDAIHPPSSLQSVLTSTDSHHLLKTLKAKKIIKAHQWHKLYPSVSGSVSSSNFDITLLFLLLRNICRLSPPTSTGSWDKPPAATDTSKEADLVRIKYYRNTIYGHITETASTDADFEQLWSEIEGAFLRLSGSSLQSDIERLKVDTIDPDEAEYCNGILEDWEKNDQTLMDKLIEIEAMIKPIKNTKGPPFNKEDMDLYAAKLKEAIRKQTQMQTKGIINAESVKTDDIFTNLVVHYGRQNFPLQRNKEDQRERKTLTEIKKCSEIFIDEDEQKNPKRIIVSGEPGIGKTMFSQKLVRDMAANNISIPKVNFTYLIKFRQLSEFGDDRLINLKELLNLCPLLDDTAMIDEAVMEYMCENSAQLFIVLDGFDEYKDRSKILDDFETRFPNCAKTKMPVAALVSKLIHKKVLKDSVILVTSRPTGANEFSQKIHCDRYVKIKGFTENQVVEYVKKYFSSKSEEFKKKALDRVLGSSLYMEFGSIPFRCYLMCIYIEVQITKERDDSLPATLTKFYCQVIECIERNYNRVILSLDEESASFAVDKTLANFTKLAMRLFEQKRFSFTLNDLEKLGLSKNESLQITSSNLIFCNPVCSNLAFQKPTCEYSFAHFTIQEFFVGWYLAKMAGAMPEQETTEMVNIFTSGLLGLEETEKSVQFMEELLKCVNKDEGRRRVVSLRCLYEFGQEKQLTTQQLTTNPDNTYWDGDIGRIELDDLTDSDCSTIVGLLIEKSAVASSPPHVLYIEDSLLTFRGVNNLFSFLTKPACTITGLELRHCQLNDDCAKGFNQHLSNTKITHLDLGYNEITDTGLQHVNHCSNKLTHLYLVDNEITDTGLQHIVDHCSSKLTHLHLGRNEITDKGVKHMVNHCPSTLTHINLAFNPVSGECKNNTRKWCKDNYPGFQLDI